jgi:glycosyltransferase involved in cell wall biosynthesis
MASPVRVSLIIPAYNYAGFLPGTLDSALSQGVDGLEIVLVDDGSTDETPAVAASYGPAVRWLRASAVRPCAWPASVRRRWSRRLARPAFRRS